MIIVSIWKSWILKNGLGDLYRMIIYLLLFTTIILFCFSFVVFNRDIMSPTVVLCASYFLSISAAIYNIDTWNIDLGIQTYSTIILGLVIFFVVEYMMKSSSQQRVILQNKSFTLEYIYISNFKIILYIIISLFITFFYYTEVLRVASEHGYYGIGNFLTYYRNAASYGLLALDDDINQIVYQLFKIVQVMCYIYLYIFLNNWMYIEKKVRKLGNLFKYLIPIIIYLITSVLTANRLQYIRLTVAGFLMYYIIWHRKNGWNKHIASKIFFRGVIALLLLLCLFVALRGVVGRINNQKPIDYLTRYAGASIELFDQYLKMPAEKDGYFGGETFYAIHNILRKLGLSNFNEISHLEFRRLGYTMYASNTYTSLRRYIHDFGYGGMIFLQALLAIIYCYSYYYGVISLNSYFAKKNKDLYIILYSYFFYAVPLHSINEIFYSSFLSLNSLIIIILFLFCWKYVKNVRFIFRADINF